MLLAGNMSIDCDLVVFDKDGTLIDLTSVLLALAQARGQAVENKGGKEVSDLWQKTVGVDLRNRTIDYTGPLATAPRPQEILIAATAFYLKGHSWESARQMAQEAYDVADQNMKPPYGSVLLNGVEATLRKMKSQGLKLVIASTDTHRRIVQSFQALEIDSLFDAFVGDDDVINGKPHPDMIAEATKKTGVPPAQTVMIGDSVSDMQMGKNAHVKACIGVLTGSTEKEKLARYANIVIPSVAEISVL